MITSKADQIFGMIGELRTGHNTVTNLGWAFSSFNTSPTLAGAFGTAQVICQILLNADDDGQASTVQNLRDSALSRAVDVLTSTTASILDSKLLLENEWNQTRNSIDFGTSEGSGARRRLYMNYLNELQIRLPIPSVIPPSADELWQQLINPSA